jgi:hypothetical protein
MPSKQGIPDPIYLSREISKISVYLYLLAHIEKISDTSLKPRVRKIRQVRYGFFRNKNQAEA